MAVLATRDSPSPSTRNQSPSPMGFSEKRGSSLENWEEKGIKQYKINNNNDRFTPAIGPGSFSIEQVKLLESI